MKNLFSRQPESTILAKEAANMTNTAANNIFNAYHKEVMGRVMKRIKTAASLGKYSVSLQYTEHTASINPVVTQLESLGYTTQYDAFNTLYINWNPNETKTQP
jgi:hypothetical protein